VKIAEKKLFLKRGASQSGIEMGAKWNKGASKKKGEGEGLNRGVRWGKDERRKNRSGGGILAILKAIQVWGKKIENRAGIKAKRHEKGCYHQKRTTKKSLVE